MERPAQAPTPKGRLSDKENFLFSLFDILIVRGGAIIESRSILKLTSGSHCFPVRGLSFLQCKMVIDRIYTPDDYNDLIKTAKNTGYTVT